MNQQADNTVALIAELYGRATTAEISKDYWYGEAQKAKKERDEALKKLEEVEAQA